jgi:adenosylcobinamide-GDP ribazoletransferase
VKSSWTARLKELPPWVAHPLLCFLAAFRFLTIVPFHWRSDCDGDYFQHSLHYFPVLGSLVGLAVAGLSMLLRFLLPGSVVTVITIILLAVVSGCLHLDGLADTADGFFSSRPKEKILEIMRDSRTGAMGVIVIVLVLLLKFTALSTLAPSVFLKTVFLMPLAGRCAIVLSMAMLPYARQEEGLGSLFYSKYCRWSALWSSVFLIALMPFLGIKAIVLAACTTGSVVLIFAFWCKKKIGGATGDTLGAVCEITETAIAVSFANIFLFS